ncbi:MAG TPA: nitroreductase/quinone reductase family protein [Chloroflexota bacterium]|nr:nitroreductase/quinone reductase family protein [Chloroflexota bacterium]
MDERIRQALAQEKTIDITTIGRRSGEPRRLEIWFHNLAGKIYITGTPGKRDWYANLVANPEFTFHLKGQVAADLPARATPITGPAERRAVLGQILAKREKPAELEKWLKESPLVEVSLQ